MMNVQAKVRKRSKKKVAIWTLLIAAFLIAFFYTQNNLIGITKMEVDSKKIPKAFDGYRFVQVSDLHSKSFGENQQTLADKIKDMKPDAIMLTGDIVDSKRYDEEAALDLVKQCAGIAPVYFVTGNHEWWSGKYEQLEKKLKAAGAAVLRNESREIKKGNQSINLLGIDDPAIESDSYNEAALVNEELKKAKDTVKNPNNYSILLSHRPESFSVYAENKIDLVLAGHAHGGQIRIPFIGGIVAPNQGVFPKLTSGKHVSGSTSLIISRGLGNSIIPLRIFNQPELIELTLHHE